MLIPPKDKAGRQRGLWERGKPGEQPRSRRAPEKDARGEAVMEYGSPGDGCDSRWPAPRRLVLDAAPPPPSLLPSPPAPSLPLPGLIRVALECVV